MLKLPPVFSGLSLNNILGRLAAALVVFALLAQPACAQSLPQAAFTVNKQTGSLLETFQFDAAASTDSKGQKRGLRYFWDFGDSSTAEGVKVSHKYKAVGFYDVGLKVVETSGLQASTVMRVEVRQSLPPGLQVKVTPAQGTTDDSFTFNAMPFSFIGSTQEQLLVRWDFDGDGTFDTTFAKQKEVVHNYQREGLYTPIIEVKDLDGTTKAQTGYTVYRNGQVDTTQIGRIQVGRGSGRLLQGSFTVTPTVGPVSTNFHFDASASASGGGSGGLLYRWDFDGDGKFDTDWQASPTADYVYTYDGQKTVELQIKDRNGAISRGVRTVQVEKININPEIDFSIQVVGVATSQKAPLVVVGSEVRFTANLRDRNGSTSVLTVRWDFDGDGKFETDFGGQRQITYRYLTAGEKQVKLEVRDRDGGLSSRVKPITVIANEPPKASLSVTPAKGTTSTKFSFNASKVSDSLTPVGQLRVQFDFDSDGVFETEFTGQKIESHTYSTPGVKKALVQVIDHEGSMATAVAEVVVLGSAAPHAQLVAKPAVGLLSTTFQLDAATSMDLGTGSNKGLLYLWRVGEGNAAQAQTQFSNQSRISVRYLTPGAKAITVEVKSPDGAVSKASQTIEVHWAAGYLAEAKKVGFILNGNDGVQIKALAQPIKRLDFLRLLMTVSGQWRAITPVEQQKLLSAGKLPFIDVAKLSLADRAMLATAIQKGVISANTNFNGERFLTRAEALKLIFKAYNLTPASDGTTNFNDVSASLWPAGYIKQAVTLGFVRGYGDGTFRPFYTVRIDEALKLIYRGK